MYILIVTSLMLVFPTISLLIELFVFNTHSGLLFLIGKWFVFWGVGVRLFTAGLRQALQPQFTARDIFEITDPQSLLIVRELGFANLSLGLLGLFSIVDSNWITPSAVAGALFYGLAVVQHLMHKDKNSTEIAATVSGLFLLMVLVVYLGGSLWKF